LKDISGGVCVNFLSFADIKFFWFEQNVEKFFVLVKDDE
jgi:hypothetical protein